LLLPQVVMLGSGAADYEARVRAASHEYGWFCKGHAGFSVPLSHKIIAGCDILIMPSRYVLQLPCMLAAACVVDERMLCCTSLSSVMAMCAT
jgi:glycogen synthase